MHGTKEFVGCSDIPDDFRARGGACKAIQKDKYRKACESVVCKNPGPSAVPSEMHTLQSYVGLVAQGLYAG